MFSKGLEKKLCIILGLKLLVIITLFRNEAWTTKAGGKKGVAAVPTASVVLYLVHNGTLHLSMPKSSL